MKVYTGRIIIGIGDSYHEVEPFVDPSKDMYVGRAYINKAHVYIYKGTLENASKLKEGECGTILGKIVYSTIKSHEISAKHSVDNIIELNMKKIFNDIENNPDSFTTADAIEIINNNADIFIPTINPDDDFLKYVIKKAIISKKINLKNYKNRSGSVYDLNNLKSSLTGKTKMTVPYFLKWVEILGLDWEVRIWDDGSDRVAPLKDILSIDSRTMREDTEI